jgi:hypothetical protein
VAHTAAVIEDATAAIAIWSSQKATSSLRERANWTGTNSIGRLSRIPLWQLRAHTASGSIPVSEDLASALRILVTLNTDYTMRITSTITQSWIERKTQIVMAKAFATIAGLLTSSKSFTNCNVVWFIDNEAACDANIRGTSGSSDLADYIGASVCLAAELRSRIWFEWSDTAAMCSTLQPVSKMRLDMKYGISKCRPRPTVLLRQSCGKARVINDAKAGEQNSFTRMHEKILAIYVSCSIAGRAVLLRVTDIPASFKTPKERTFRNTRPASIVASMFSLVTHACATDEDAIYSNEGDYYYEGASTCFAQLPHRDFHAQTYATLFVVSMATVVLSWKCASRRVDKVTPAMDGAGCTSPAPAPDEVDPPEQTGQAAHVSPGVFNPPLQGEISTPVTERADVRVQTESQLERQIFGKKARLQQLGGYTSQGGTKIHLSRTCIQHCSPLGEQAVIVHREWCKLCSGTETCHHWSD